MLKLESTEATTIETGASVIHDFILATVDNLKLLYDTGFEIIDISMKIDDDENFRGYDIESRSKETIFAPNFHIAPGKTGPRAYKVRYDWIGVTIRDLKKPNGYDVIQELTFELGQEVIHDGD